MGSTNITEEERKQYSKVLEKFDSHFQVRRNLIFERARFNKRDQMAGESAEQYITVFEYHDFRSEMIRDRFIVGIRDTALSEKLQMDTALTYLGKGKTIIQTKQGGPQTADDLIIS